MGSLLKRETTDRLVSDSQSETRRPSSCGGLIRPVDWDYAFFVTRLGEPRESSRRTTLAERFQRATERNAPLVILFFTALLVSSIVTIGGAVVGAIDWIQRQTTDWREKEYEVLAGLRAGYSIEKFRSELGPPVFERFSENQKFHESSFLRPGYWVQAVADRAGSVVLFSVSACDETFHPSFEVTTPPSRREGTRASPITLNRTTFDEVEVAGTPGLRYVLSTATGNVYFYDWISGGNPENYKSFAWGINDACPAGARLLQSNDLLPFEEVPGVRTGSGLPRNPHIRQFRSRTEVNTYAETAPFIDFEDVTGQFQIGVDRILTRTAPSPGSG